MNAERLDYEVQARIERYNPSSNLGYTARLFLALCAVNHKQVLCHCQRVSLIAEVVALRTGQDAKAAFFAGLLHDIGKMLLPFDLFDGHNISAEEYQLVKQHVLAGFEAMKEFHLFVAFCSGLHHALYSQGYGLQVSDFPESLSPATVRKILNIATIISVCDFADAATHRTTKILDGSDNGSTDLREMLRQKYPDDHPMIDIVLETNSALNQ